jgi:rare lipoprotein A (peptidoglycan hydrolase)
MGTAVAAVLPMFVSALASRVVVVVVLASSAVAIACSGPPPFAEGAGEDPGDEDVTAAGEAFTVSARTGARFTTTARLNFREGPSKSATIMRVLARGAVVTTIRATPQNGYFQVQQDGDEGWVHGNYLRSASASATSGAADDDTTAPSTSTSGGTGTGTGTGTGQIESCRASFYDEGQQTANGERFDPSALTAAHKTLRFNTRVRVTNTGNGKSVTVRINDRGPFVAGRCIDLSRAAFEAIASTSQGTASVTVEVVR